MMIGRFACALPASYLSIFFTFALLLAPSAKAQGADITEVIEVCTGCHGESGLPDDSQIPIIWGQEFYYLYVQLKDYKAGRRANEIMQGIVADLEREQLRALAQHFSERPWPTISYTTPDESKSKAQGALTAGQCVQCHLGGYEGNSRIPRLAKQQAEYLERTMLEFKQKVRLNSPAKGSLLESYEDAEIAAMAHHLAGL